LQQQLVQATYVSNNIMKRLQIINLFLLIASNTFGQGFNEEIVNTVLQKEIPNQYNFVISNDLDMLFIQRATESLYSKQQTFTDYYYKNNVITLSSSEKEYLVKNLKEQYKATWNLNQIGKMKILDSESAKIHAAENLNNGYIFISKPILIRDNKIALIYFGYVVGEAKLDKPWHGVTSLALYKLNSENKWEKWIRLGGGIYN
jgi:hypothetical protein